MVSILFFHCFFGGCDGDWWLPLTGLPWIPYKLGLVCSWSPPSFHQSKRKILKSTCTSDNHHREFGCLRPKSDCPKRFVQTVFRNKINSTCGLWCTFIYSNVNCELFTRVQMLLKIKKNRTFSTLLQVTHLIPCRYDDLIDSRTFRCFFLFNDILKVKCNEIGPSLIISLNKRY